MLNNMVEQLALHTDIFYKKRFGTYNELFRDEPITVIHPDGYLNTYKGTLVIDVKKTNKKIWEFEFEYSYLLKKTDFECEISDLNAPVETPWGKFYFIENQINIDPDYPDYKVRLITRTRKENIKRYAKLISVGLTSKKTNVMTIFMIGENPAKNEAIINKMIELYEEDALSDKNKTAVQMSTFINERLSRLDLELDDVEQKVQDYRTENNLANITEQSRIVIESVSEYDKLMLAVEMEVSAVNLIDDYIKNSDPQALIPSTTGIEDESLSGLIISYNEQVLEYLRLTRSTNESNPFVSQLKTKISLTRENILQTITNVKAGLALKKQELLSKNKSIEEQIASVPKIEREFIKVAREQEIKRALYVFLLQKREETQLSLSSATNTTKIIDQAYTSIDPVAPRKKIILLASVILALIISCAYLYIDSLINNKVEDRKMLKRLTSIPIIGVLPFEKGASSIVVKKGETTSIVEMFKLIRANLKFIFKTPEDKVLLVTSSIPTEGKSFFSVNMAISLALLDKKVALVGLDIRKPRLADYMDVKKKTGIVDFIADNSYSLDEIAETYKDNDNLDIFISGTIPPDPSELLNNPRLNELFDYLRQNYDYIIIDSAPIGMVSDTLVINSFADAVVYIARCGVTPKEYIQNLDSLTYEGQLSNVSIVLNGVSNDKLTGYGYGYGYRQDNGKKRKLFT
jgi:capsular exopolysaccharide synthesis family protein